MALKVILQALNSIFKIYSSNFKQLREIIPLFPDCNCIALSIEVFSKQIEKNGDAFAVGVEIFFEIAFCCELLRCMRHMGYARSGTDHCVYLN